MPSLNQRGIFDPITWFIIVMAFMLVGGIAMIYGVPCDQATQKCLDENSRTMEAPPGVSK